MEDIFEMYVSQVEQAREYFGTPYIIEKGNYFRTIVVQYYEKGLLTVVEMITLLHKISNYEREIGL